MQLTLQPSTTAEPRVRLISKYQPQSADELVVPKNHNISAGFNFLEEPYSEAFLMVGKPGIGKTSLAVLMARAATENSPHGIIHVVGPDLDSYRVKSLEDELRSRPLLSPMVAVVCDEADAIPRGGQIRLLRLLDALPPHACMIFTSNESLDNFEARFLSRLKVLKFTTQGLIGPGSEWLCRIAQKEGYPLTPSDAEKRLRDSRNNLRQALTQLEVDMFS